MKRILFLLFLLPSRVLCQSQVQPMMQTSCCSDTLVINTGYNILSATTVVPGCNGCINPDPKWNISFISTSLITLINANSYTPVLTNSPADVILPFGGYWTTNPNSGWINCFDATWFVGTSPDSIYSMQFNRVFTMCNDACVTFNLNICDDNWISDVHVDSLPSFYFQNSATVHYNSFAPVVSPCYSLSQGPHTLFVTVVEDHTHLENAVGLNIYGTIISPVGTNSLKSENNPSCDSNTTSVIKVSTIDIEIYPNPASSTLTLQTKQLIISINITNFLGQTVLTKQMHGEVKTEIDISHLPNGVYFVNAFTSNGEKVVRKFVKG